jgi:predicted metal-dependent hydrolase
VMAKVSMMTSIKTEIDGIGSVLFEKSKRAKRLNITIRPFRGVRVAVPRRVSFAKAERFVHAKGDWIRKHLAKMKEEELQRQKIIEDSKSIDRAFAKQKLISRLDELAGKNGFRYNGIFIKNQKSRWGSCSGKNNINLNMKLATLPGELMDYVILHELVHTKVKNHGKKFWAELDKLVGDAKARDKELRKFGVHLAE